MTNVTKLARKNWKPAFSFLLVAFMLFLTACGSNGASPGSQTSPQTSPQASSQASSQATPQASAAANNEPIKIGVLLSFTGSFAPLAESIKNGIDIYFAQHNGMIGNHKVELKYEDDEGNPQVALRKYHQLVDSEKVDMLVGPISSAVVYALRDQIEKDKILLIDLNAAANDISWAKKSNYIYRIAMSNWQSGSSGAAYFATLGKKAFVIAPDYAAGHENADAFERAYKAAGGTVIQSVFPKLGTNDFATYLTQITEAKPDIVFAIETGTDGIRLLQQYKQFGLLGKIPLTSWHEYATELVTGPAGDAAEGVISAANYIPTLDNPINKKFVESYVAQYKKNPDEFSVNGFDSGQVITTAIEKAGSFKTADLINVLKGISYDSPRGQITIDAKTNNPILNMYIVKNVKKDGKIVQEILETVKDVTMPATDPTK
ncbi:MAG: ABC transporter substrate-binding protein [Paenibacillaceae bacterium]